METIEVIKVRTGNSHSKAVFDVHQQLSADVETMMQNCAVTLYRNISVTGDFAYFLCWDEGMTEPEGSPLGIRIRKSLESLGLVDHTMWSLFEQPDKQAAVVGK